eukprot:6441257-Pyramimonas_sp.AAC.1
MQAGQVPGISPTSTAASTPLDIRTYTSSCGQRGMRRAWGFDRPRVQRMWGFSGTQVRPQPTRSLQSTSAS